MKSDISRPALCDMRRSLYRRRENSSGGDSRLQSWNRPAGPVLKVLAIRAGPFQGSWRRGETGRDPTSKDSRISKVDKRLLHYQKWVSKSKNETDLHLAMNWYLISHCGRRNRVQIWAEGSGHVTVYIDKLCCNVWTSTLPVPTRPGRPGDNRCLL